MTNQQKNNLTYMLFGGIMVGLITTLIFIGFNILIN